MDEHEIIVWKAFPDVIEIEEGQSSLAPHHPRIPMSFSIGATKPGEAAQ